MIKFRDLNNGDKFLFSGTIYTKIAPEYSCAYVLIPHNLWLKGALRDTLVDNSSEEYQMTLANYELNWQELEDEAYPSL